MLSGYFRTSAQDIHFSQLYEMPVLRNPALTGLFQGNIRGAAAFRTQWGGINALYKTFSVGAEYKIHDLKDDQRWLKESIGLQVSSDRAGDSKLSKTQIMPVWNFHLPLSLRKENKSFLSLAVTGGLVMHGFERSGLTFDDQFVNGANIGTSSQKFNRTSCTYPAGGFGFIFNFGGFDADESRFYFGGSIVNFSFYKRINYFLESVNLRQDVKLGFNAGATRAFTDETRMHFFADYFKQGHNNLLQFGFLYAKDIIPGADGADKRVGLSAGVFYRLADAVIPFVKLEYYNLQIGLSYDANAVRRMKMESGHKDVFELTVSLKDFLNFHTQTDCPIDKADPTKNP